MATQTRVVKWSQTLIVSVAVVEVNLLRRIYYFKRLTNFLIVNQLHDFKCTLVHFLLNRVSLYLCRLHQPRLEQIIKTRPLESFLLQALIDQPDQLIGSSCWCLLDQLQIVLIVIKRRFELTQVVEHDTE